MLNAKATPVRRKLRVARGRWASRSLRRKNSAGQARPASSIPSRASTFKPADVTASKRLAETVLAIATSASAAVVGFQLCAGHTRDETIFVAAKSAAGFLQSLVAATARAALARRIDVRPRARTSDRLRLEWIASTATVMDVAPDGRLVAECARLLSDVDAGPAEELGDAIAARFRAAAVEAYSLASAIEHMRRGQLVLALA